MGVSCSDAKTSCDHKARAAANGVRDKTTSDRVSQRSTNVVELRSAENMRLVVLSRP